MCDNDLFMHCAVPCAHFRATECAPLARLIIAGQLVPKRHSHMPSCRLLFIFFVAKLYSVATCSTFISGIDQNGLLCRSSSRAKSNQFHLQQYLLSRHNRINLFEWQPVHIACGKLDRVWQCLNHNTLTHSNRSREKQIAVTVPMRAINLLVYHSADRKKTARKWEKWMRTTRDIRTISAGNFACRLD